MRPTILILIWCGLMAFADCRLFAADRCQCQVTGTCTCGPNCTCGTPATLTALRQDCHGGICPAGSGPSISYGGGEQPGMYGGPVRGAVRGTARVGGRMVGRAARGAGRVLTAPFRLFRGCRGGRCG